MSAAQFLADASYAVILAVPDPGQGVAPPGSENLLEVLQWAAWIAFGVCVLGFVIAGAAMAASSLLVVANSLRLRRFQPPR